MILLTLSCFLTMTGSARWFDNFLAWGLFPTSNRFSTFFRSLIILPSKWLSTFLESTLTSPVDFRGDRFDLIILIFVFRKTDYSNLEWNHQMSFEHVNKRLLQISWNKNQNLDLFQTLNIQDCIRFWWFCEPQNGGW